eukprot:CAMPEP_0173395772 /NCGR_PEP_ID=MMETSP1356-20130122/33312_1 /TAXON_ID=77927 ORGANISM="Hemiselmis virescens, Strain PCC157" /NCGR_SAMPLE_ID=MMETSP1356 /ASSEMBLY_ACC=CAM_ASM_000847 /LENGTH=182 /DNA_ID=CAMNT_0014354621 /DNA_START=46 /DNA_END=594 /DNA_ORIENTATION=+
MAAARVLILPGNGCTPIKSANWYAWLQRSLKDKGVDCFCENMPDPHEAKESIWLPFIRDTMKADSNCVLVGHSSGAEAAMRLMETTKVRGAVLVAACHTDLGIESEAISGYYNRPWQWQKIKENSEFLVQYADTDDPFIPYEEAVHVAENLGTELISKTRSDHFMTQDFPDLLETIMAKIGK